MAFGAAVGQLKEIVFPKRLCISDIYSIAVAVVFAVVKLVHIFGAVDFSFAEIRCQRLVGAVCSVA